MFYHPLYLLLLALTSPALAQAVSPLPSAGVLGGDVAVGPKLLPDTGRYPPQFLAPSPLPAEYQKRLAATRVSYQGADTATAMQAICKQAGVPITPLFDRVWDRAKWPRRAVALRNEPLGAAILTLTEQFRLTPDGVMLGMNGHDDRQQTWITSGPFLIAVRHLDAVGPPREFALSVYVQAEPKITLLGYGEPMIEGLWDNRKKVAWTPPEKLQLYDESGGETGKVAGFVSYPMPISGRLADPGSDGGKAIWNVKGTLRAVVAFKTTTLDFAKPGDSAEFQGLTVRWVSSEPIKGRKDLRTLWKVTRGKGLDAAAWRKTWQWIQLARVGPQSDKALALSGETPIETERSADAFGFEHTTGADRAKLSITLPTEVQELEIPLQVKTVPVRKPE